MWYNKRKSPLQPDGFHPLKVATATESGLAYDGGTTALGLGKIVGAERSIPVVHLLWEQIDRVRFSALRQFFSTGMLGAFPGAKRVRLGSIPSSPTSEAQAGCAVELRRRRNAKASRRGARQAKRRRDAQLSREGDEMPKPVGVVPDQNTKGPPGGPLKGILNGNGLRSRFLPETHPR